MNSSKILSHDSAEMTDTCHKILSIVDAAAQFRTASFKIASGALALN